MFEKVANHAGDPIFSLAHAFKMNSRKDKINLSIGMYQDENGVVPQLQSIKIAKHRLKKWEEQASLYLPIEGLPDYCAAIGKLLFGEDNFFSRQDRLATIQAVGGSSALKIGADFLQCYFPDSEVWVSDPTWQNHHAIFGGVGFKVNVYPYFDQINKGVLFDNLCETLNQLPEKSIVLFHPCCHNPTGADLTRVQWDTLIPILKERDIIPFLDIAYQGFGAGLVDDCYAIQAMALAHLPCFISNSFSKNFSLYGERVGGLTVVCQHHDEKERVLGQLRTIIRRNYSNPPSYGARQVATVLNDAELFKLWSQEVESMRCRIAAVRKNLASRLTHLLPDKNFSYLVNQRGMFSYTGLNALQIRTLREQYGIYLINNGRINIAGLNSKNIENVTSAIAAL